MPVFTLERTCVQYYRVEAAALEDVLEEYAAGNAVLGSEETLDYEITQEESDEEE